MRRKSVTYLNSLRLELNESIQALHEASEHLERCTFEISQMDGESFRKDEFNVAADSLKNARRHHSEVGKQLKLVVERIENYKSFF